MALHRACRWGRSGKVRQLIQEGHDVNAYDKSGWTPLLKAAYHGHVKAARELIRANADVHLKVKGTGRTGLCIAAFYIYQVVKFIFCIFMKYICDASIEQSLVFEGRTALMLAVQRGHSGVVAELVRAGADVSIKDKKGMTAVLLAKSYDMVCQLVRDVDCVLKEDRSHILWHACNAGDLSKVRSVIEAGCDVDHIHKGQTPLMMATLRGHNQIVKELILANCDVNQHSEGYYSDLASSLNLARTCWLTVTVWIAIMVPCFGLLLALGRPVVVPSWVNPVTGSVAALVSPVCVVAAAMLPVSWPAGLLWLAVVANLLALMVAVAVVAGPVAWAVAAAMAMAVLLRTWGLKATMAATVKVFVFIAKTAALGVCMIFIIVLVLLGAAVLFLDVKETRVEESFVGGLFGFVLGYHLVISAVDMVTKKQVTAVLIRLLCTLICIVEPTWPWMNYSSTLSLLMFYLMEWIAVCKAPKATALHYAAGHNRIECGALLVEAGADLRSKNKCLWTPSDIGSNRLEDEVKKTLSFTAKRTIAVIGHARRGKSTLIAALQTESKTWWMKGINYFRKVQDIRHRTAGIEPIQFSSQRYGETLFYDFAGQSQYHGPHQSFLEAMLGKLGVSASLLLLVKATEEEDIVAQQLHRWLQPLAQRSVAFTPQVIVVGSFLDQVKSEKEARKKLLRCTQLVQKDLPFHLLGPCILDCQRPESRGINQIRGLLQEVKAMQLNTKSHSYNLHWVLVQVRKAFLTPALRLYEFQTWLQDNAVNLPSNLPSPEEVCQDLSSTGHALFLPNKQDPSQSWLVLDLQALLHDVYGTLFSGSQGKVNEFGLLHCSQLAKLFPKLDHTLIQDILIGLEFCIEVDPKLLKKELSQLTIDEGGEGWLYFPALVLAESCEVFSEDPDPDKFQWMCWQLRTAEKHFISAHLLQTVILHLAANHVYMHKLSPTVKQHCCSVWVNGISWSSTKGVDVAVQISKDSVFQVVGCSKAGHERLQEYTVAIVRDVIKTITQLSPKLEATPYIVHPYTPPVRKEPKPPQPKPPQPNTVYPVSSVIDCISNDDDHVLSLSPSTSSIPIGQLFGGQPPPLSTVQDLMYPRVAQNGELTLSLMEIGEA